MPGLDGRFRLGRRRADRRRRRRRARRARRVGARRRSPPRSCSPRDGRRRDRRASSRASTRRRSRISAALLARVPLAVSVEAHYVDGGLGSLVAEMIAERGPGLPPRALRGADDARRASRAAASTCRSGTACRPARGRPARRSRERSARSRRLNSDRPAGPQPGGPHRGRRRGLPPRARAARRGDTSSCWSRTPAATDRPRSAAALAERHEAVRVVELAERRLGPRGPGGPRCGRGRPPLLHELGPHAAARC